MNINKAPWSSGQDASLSRWNQGFDSPRSHWKESRKDLIYKTFRDFSVFRFENRAGGTENIKNSSNGLQSLRSALEMKENKIVFLFGMGYNKCRFYIKYLRAACMAPELRIGGIRYVSISNRNASESKSRTLCSRSVQHQQS